MSNLAELYEEQSRAAAPALTLKEVAVTFGGVHALEGVSFDIEPLEVVAVVGPNGAGKTSLLNVCSGLAAGHVSGAASVFGVSIIGVGPVAVARAGVARSFQNPPLIEKATVLENVLVGLHSRTGYGPLTQIARWRRLSRQEAAMRDRVSTVLHFTALQDVWHRTVSELPYGTRKVVDICRALVAGPRLLLLDEPTSGLDLDEKDRLIAVLRQLREEQLTTVVVVEHHMDVVQSVATDVITLRSGRVVHRSGSGGTINAAELIKSATLDEIDQTGKLT